MPLTNEDIIAGLVANYRRSGVDMTSLMGDPIFASMGVADKLAAIKKYAADIHNGSSNNLSNGEKKRIAVDSVFSAWPLLPALATLAMKGPIAGALPGVRSKTLMGIGLGGAVIGVGLGAMQGYLQAKQRQDYRTALRSNLQNVIHDPNDINALGVLSSDHISRQSLATKEEILNRVKSELHKFNPGDWALDNFESQLVANNNQAKANQAVANARANLPN